MALPTGEPGAAIAAGASEDCVLRVPAPGVAATLEAHAALSSASTLRLQRTTRQRWHAAAAELSERKPSALNDRRGRVMRVKQAFTRKPCLLPLLLQRVFDIGDYYTIRTHRQVSFLSFRPASSASSSPSPARPRAPPGLLRRTAGSAAATATHATIRSSHCR